MIHIKRNICLVAVSCTLLAGIPLQGVAQTGRTAKVQATQSNKITVSGTVLDKTTNDPLIGVSVVVMETPLSEPTLLKKEQPTALSRIWMVSLH